MAHRILIADDSQIFREGLRVLVQSHENWVICGEAVDGSEAIQKTRQLRPDLVIMDFSMPGASGIDAAREIRREFPRLPILLLALFLTRQLAADAHQAGIGALVSKTNSRELLNGIQAVLEGKEYCPSTLEPTTALRYSSVQCAELASENGPTCLQR
jgi:two-component system, NarL family, invasion response regulator UvrY